MAKDHGCFISVDGPSGVGKTAVSALLVGKLQAVGIGAVLTTTPSKSAIGELARHGTFNFHGRALTCLVAADRYYHDQTIVKPTIAEGTAVVCDRYVPSSLVLDARDGVLPEFLGHIYDGITIPDVAVMLLGDPQLCAERAAVRGKYSRFHSTSTDDSATETRAFAVAADDLLNAGYPVHLHNIGEATADQVADALLPAILAAKGYGA